MFPIALDSMGRKFSNCTALSGLINYEIGTEFSEGLLSNTNSNTWTQVKNYLNGNKNLV
jgi:hypothetical protein